MQENENTLKISNEALLEDIRITKIEQESYQKLVDAFMTLSSLPENIGTFAQTKYRTQASIYSSMEAECSSFLRSLYEIKALRGI